MKNKKKWASILTIATSLILCIISTFGITLAFFGGNASANLSTITLKTGIEIGAAIKSSVGDAKVVPGQPVKIEATGTLKVTDKGTPTAANAVDGVVRAKLTVGNELGDVTITGESDYWTAGGDGYYYLVTTQGGTTLRVVKVGDSVKLFGNLTVSKNFTNADSGKSVEASVIFETIQAGVYDSVNGGLVEMTVANATSASSPLYSSFKAVEHKETLPMYGKGITTAYYDESKIGTLSDLDEWGDIELYPYAIVDTGTGVNLYFGFEAKEKSSMKYSFGQYTSIANDGELNYTWAYYNLGTPNIENGYMIRDNTYYVMNLEDYTNIKVDDGVDGTQEAGPQIAVACYENIEVDIFLNNLNRLHVEIVCNRGGGGSN